MRYRIGTFQACVSGLLVFASGCFLLPPRHSDYRLIHQFSLGCQAEAVQAILQTNAAAVNLPDDSLRTPLHDAASRDCTNVIAVLLRGGAKLEARDRAGETPLHVAAQEGCMEAATMLLNNGAQINARDKQGYTPLKRALLYEQSATANLLRGLGGFE